VQFARDANGFRDIPVSWLRANCKARAMLA
jgi:hypothetical protein